MEDLCRRIVLESCIGELQGEFGEICMVGMGYDEHLYWEGYEETIECTFIP